MPHPEVHHVDPDGLIELVYVASRTINGERFELGEFDTLQDAELAIRSDQEKSPEGTQKCHNCEGSGKYGGEECNMCAGTGRIPE